MKNNFREKAHKNIISELRGIKRAVNNTNITQIDNTIYTKRYNRMQRYHKSFRQDMRA